MRGDAGAGARVVSNPILIVQNAGYGTTPEYAAAKFKPRDVCKYRGEEVIVCVVVPPGQPAEYAVADAQGQPRPLMVTRPSRAVLYVVGREDGNEGKPNLIPERKLKATGKTYDGPLFPGDAQ